MKFFSSLGVLAALLTFASANPVITEFMADNTGTIADDDGEFSDWIEIHNPTAAPINLDQWALTDSSSQLTKWRFPAFTLEPGAFLVVWASGKNRVNPSAPLHTNFSLASGGEYLGLVRPDGATIQQQFSPAYPAQAANESYGLQFSTTNLLVQGATARYLVPPNGSLGTSWVAPGFGDAAWSSGPTGLGFGLLIPGITVRNVNKNAAPLSNLAETDALFLSGGVSETTVVASTVNYLGNGSDGHYGANQVWPNGGGDYFAIKATGFIQIPASGVYSFGINSDDGGRVRIDGVNVMVDDTNHGAGDHIGTATLAAGLHSFEIVMWEQGGGDECEFYAKAGTPASATTWDANMKLVGDTANGGLAAYTTPSGAGGVIGTNIAGVMQNINPGCYSRNAFPATGPGAFTSLSLKMRYADGYVAYLNGAQIAAKNAPVTPVYNSMATATRTTSQALAVEPLNITHFLPSLINGTNVLAVHGMNNSAADGQFLVLPELTAGTLNAAAQAVFYGSNLATPGGINGAYSVLGKVEDTQFSVRRGFFTAPFQLQITSPTPGATIRYTTNCSTPTETNGTIYTGPITISGTTTLRARAFKTGWLATDTDTQTYIFLGDVITQAASGAAPSPWPTGPVNSQILDYGMDPDIVNSADPAIGGSASVQNALKSISTISIVTDQANLTNSATGIYVNPGGRGFSWERACSLEMINPPSAANPNGTSEFQVNCGIRVRGGYSRDPSNPKHGFHLYFRGDYGDTKLSYPIFGRYGTDTFDQIDLRTAQNYSWSFGGDGNNTFLREEATRLAQTDLGAPGSHIRYVHLYLNGQYWGLFNFDERTEANFSATYSGGNKDDYDVVKCEQDSGYVTGVTDGNLNAWQALWNQSRAHYSAPTNANYFKMQGLAADGVTATADPVYLDVDNLIDYMLVTFWSGNLDGSTSAFLGNDRSNNWFGARDRLGTHGGFRYYVHDFEHTFFNTGEDRTGPFSTTAGNWGNFTYASPMFLHQDLTPNAEYKMRWADRIHKHMFNTGQLTQAGWTARFNKLAAIVDSAIIAESARWGDSKVATPLNKNNWLAAKNTILNSYLPVRGASVLAQLQADGLYPTLGAPGMAPFGGYVNNGAEVVMTNNGGTIYYMPDGSDPRAVGGALRAGALIYNASTTNETLIPLVSSWRYKDDGSNQGTDWRLPEGTGAGQFNSSAWLSGNAELGFGDGDETTTTNGGPSGSRYATTYFRRTFTVANPSNITALNVSLKFDDEAWVYVNGTLAFKTDASLPDNPAYNYYSGIGTPNESAYFPFTISPSLLVNGSNTIAVEVHQANNTSSDVSFIMSLTATRTSTATPFYVTGSGVKPLRARSFDGSTWSALVDATFLVDTEPASAANLVISEIMYHPADPTPAEIAAGFVNADDFEFVELTNIGAKHVDLLDVYFYGAINFNFTGALTGRTLAPGGRVIVAAKKSAFELRYGPGKPVAGSYKGNLGNGGENVQLFFPNDTILRTVNYTDLAPWPPEADGGGYSLVLKRPTTNPDHTNPSNWRSSAAPGGDPGDNDSSTVAAYSAAHGITDLNADNDKDALTNFQEYALGGNPNSNSQAERPIISEGGGYAMLTFTFPTNNDDIAYVVEGTSDIANAASWSGANATLVSSTKNPSGTTTVQYRSTMPISGATKQFLRLNTQLLP